MEHVERFRQGSRVRRQNARRGSSPAATSEQLLHAVPVAMYACDAEGHITFFNQAAAELWGRTPQIGKDKWCGALRLLTPDGKQISPGTCPMAVAVLEGRTVRGEEVI